MPQLSQELMLDSAASAQQILSSRFGGPVLLGNGTSFKASGRSILFRFDVVDGPSALPRSIIVKRAIGRDNERFDPSSSQGSAVALFNDWAGLEFLGRLTGDPLLVPRCYGGDRNLGLFVMEDLGQIPRLDQILLGNDATAADTALIDMASVLARMHGLSASRRSDFVDLRDALGPRPDPLRPEQVCAGFKAILQRLANHFGVDLGAAVLSDVDRLTALFREDHPFWTYTHRDPCPDNWMLADQGIRLLDFEYGALGNSMLDGVFGRIHFPTCWCTNRIPEPVIGRMEQTYRNELVKHLPAAQDEALYARTFVEACALHTLETLRQYLTSKVRLWGIATMQQRAVLRTTLLADLTEQHGHLGPLGHWCRMLGARISQANEGQRSAHIPHYPAFREQATSLRS